MFSVQVLKAKSVLRITKIQKLLGSCALWLPLPLPSCHIEGAASFCVKAVKQDGAPRIWTEGSGTAIAAAANVIVW